MLPSTSPDAQIERIIREDWGRILASLVKSLGDFALAEDSLQDAVLSAMDHWRRNGLPRSPDAWLITVARRKALDRLRRDVNLSGKSDQIAYLLELEANPPSEEVTQVIPDKRLELIFTCCHPAIEQKSQVALTLRALGGLSTSEIAAAFLDKPATMAARLTRAKAKISAAGIPYKVPEPDDLNVRLVAVLRVIYLVFNEGYRASDGNTLTRADLIGEAIRLARIMRGLLPGARGVTGLLALMLLHDSRRHARVDAHGALVPLEHQNRVRWDRAMIREGVALVKEALADGPPEPYALQAAISALHAESPDWVQTDWRQITALYDLLWQVQPNPVIRVNQAVALSYADGPGVALALLDQVAGDAGLQSYQPYHTARGDLLARLERPAEAVAALDKALSLTHAPQEIAYLTQKRAALATP